MELQGEPNKEGNPIERFQALIAATKWRSKKKVDDVSFLLAENFGKQGVLLAIADKVQQPIKVRNEEDSDRWFRLFGGLKFTLGGSIPTKRGLQPKEFYWRHKFADTTVGDGWLILTAANGDSIVYVSKNRICWIRGESCSVVEAFDSVEAVAKYLVFALTENKMIDSFSWEENATVDSSSRFNWRRHNGLDNQKNDTTSANDSPPER
jgi:hypothetical protein